MFKLPYIEQTAIDYFNELNYNLGRVVAISIIPTAYFIQKDPLIGKFSAFVIFFVFCIVAIGKGTEYRKVVKLFLASPQNRGAFAKISLFFQTALFTISLTCIWLLAIGELNIEILKALLNV